MYQTRMPVFSPGPRWVLHGNSISIATSHLVLTSSKGESGVLSYAEIEARIKMYDLDAIHDKTAGVKYLTFDENQWVSYDDQETLQTKVDFANEQG